MRPRLLLFAIGSALLVATCVVAPADAGLIRGGAGLPRLQGNFVIPPEWAGIWTSVDSTYDCTGVLQGVDAGLDTLCAGKAILTDGASPYALQCSGTADATTVDMRCLYSEEVVTDCNLTFTIVMQGTRTGESYVFTSTVSTIYAGTAKVCDFFPDLCQRTVSRGTRIAGEPTAYCATPADETTWGRVKSRYR